MVRLRGKTVNHPDDVQLGRVGSAFFALVMTLIALVMAACALAGVVVTAKGDAFGEREVALMLIIGALFPISVRAAYVFWARVFGKVIEPLVPWWISIGPAALTVVTLALYVSKGLRAPSHLHGDDVLRFERGMGESIFLVLAPFALYAQQKKRRAKANQEQAGEPSAPQPPGDRA
jgi:hypothetical protein